MQLIDVVIDSKSVNTDSFYTYKAEDDVKVGTRLIVPFARRKKGVTAYCVGTGISTELDPSKIREVEEADYTRSLNDEMIDTAMWMRKRYGIKYIDGIKMFGTEGKRELKRKEESASETEDPGYTLTEEQQRASERICASIESSKHSTFLIKGVTNSGKTEVYLQACAKALSMGKTAIILLPEIALAMQVAERFKARFGEDSVAMLHSRLKTSERHSEWLSSKPKLKAETLL